MSTIQLVNVYRSRIPHAKYIFSDGTVAQFIGDRFTTTTESEIAQLDKEIANRHPMIYVTPGQEKMDPVDLDPELSYKKKVISEYLAGILDASGNPKRDMGNSTQGQFKAASTLNIAPITAAQGVNTFVPAAILAQQPQNIPSGLAAALNLPSPEAIAAPVSGDPDVAASLGALEAFR